MLCKILLICSFILLCVGQQNYNSREYVIRGDRITNLVYDDNLVVYYNNDTTSPYNWFNIGPSMPWINGQEIILKDIQVYETSRLSLPVVITTPFPDQISDGQNASNSIKVIPDARGYISVSIKNFRTNTNMWLITSVDGVIMQ